MSLPPADFAGDIGTQERPDVGACSVLAIEYAALTWTATAYGVPSFTRYEVERSLDGGDTWDPIAVIVTESVEAASVFELPRGVVASFRIRTVIDDGGEISAWSPSVEVTVESVQGCEWLFVSDGRPDLNVGVQVRPDREYQFPTTSAIVVKQLWDRDYQATFRPLEQRGVVALLHVTASFDNPAGSLGLRAFDALRAMFEEPTLPYVCTLDPYGNLLYSTPIMPLGSELQPFARHYADVTVIQTGVTPYPYSFSDALLWHDAQLWRGTQTWRGLP